MEEKVFTAIEFEAFFNSVKLPKTCKLDSGTTIVDVPSFLKSHLAIVNEWGNTGLFKAFYERLSQFKRDLTS